MRWFLPSTPDVLKTLHDQANVTIEGMEATVAWAGGDVTAADTVRDCEHRADDIRRELRRNLRTAFLTPMDAEDIYVLSHLLDEVLNGAKDAVREAELLRYSPDETIAAMAGLVSQGVHHIAQSFDCLRRKDGEATDHADAAVKTQRQLERIYRQGMADIMEEGDPRRLVARLEMYRRFQRLSRDVVNCADRVWYATVKEA